MSIFDLFKQVESASPAGPPEYLIVGLGNPGLEYAQTRHNAGFMTLDLLAEREHAEIKRMKFKSLCGDAVIAGKRCLLMKPTTYMNNSGQAVAEAMQFYKLPIDHIIVVYDDISLEPSRLRIRRKGSDGGHNGIKSIIYLTGEDTFPRIKLGVGKKPRPDYNLADWVLSRFTKEELDQLHIAAEHACESIALMVNGKIDEAMNRFNA
ncbi:aminoacyl-tRNA hydrolase [Ruminococcus sp.]|uniref:aminoacyl-tRNA hydrolase n=1 Tax=Ruminococcus sp. TaxID=41978 RepID=UPI0025DA4B7A|nr:aminoacyl-tRNA hydrolase [Ruminococcus sp.]MCI5815562.1 aminoacyl-tRNA hydrolase [Ruminococcus sp.]MDD7556532.1 aminoacyl-tRNA hydrolase [Ruminococcus sp.]MDY4962969.1 aminoacyl-tRNA hydrolase [Ruminococcus callidus]